MVDELVDLRRSCLGAILTVLLVLVGGRKDHQYKLKFRQLLEGFPDGELVLLQVVALLDLEDLRRAWLDAVGVYKSVHI
jgi:hypothetical protein